MKKMMSFLFLNACVFMIVEAEPVCHKCEVIREYNRTHKETDFIYYEDYLKDKEAKGQPSTTQNQTKEEAATPDKSE